MGLDEESALGVEGVHIHDDDGALGLLTVEVKQGHQLLALVSKWVDWLHVGRLHHNGLEHAYFGALGEDHGVVLVVVVEQRGVLLLGQNCLHPVHVKGPGDELVVQVAFHGGPSVLVRVPVGQLSVPEVAPDHGRGVGREEHGHVELELHGECFYVLLMELDEVEAEGPKEERVGQVGAPNANVELLALQEVNELVVLVEVGVHVLHVQAPVVLELGLSWVPVKSVGLERLHLVSVAHALGLDWPDPSVDLARFNVWNLDGKEVVASLDDLHLLHVVDIVLEQVDLVVGERVVASHVGH
mmetsp:Transcript_13127/g.22178  ORF Transcript_13127/g.22178 Transcript_13127/m.22178 type:complete len:299 (-) Transcript_13127:100-996(-)